MVELQGLIEAIEQYYKQCSKCRLVKLAEPNFYKDKRRPDGYVSRCKQCIQEYKNSDHGRRLKRNSNLLHRYGITVDEWDAILLAQAFSCKICDLQFTRAEIEGTAKRSRCRTDHDHCTGLVRGILCHPCNIAVERMDNDATWGRKVEKYKNIVVEERDDGSFRVDDIRRAIIGV